MVGLVLKDLCCMRKQAGILIILVLLYGIMYSQIREPAEMISSFALVAVLLSMILVMNSFSYDELSNWNVYALSLPLTRAGIVLSKYLLVLWAAGASTAFSILVALFKQCLNAGSWIGIYSAFGTAAGLCCVLIPLLFQFGMQRARLLIGVVCMVPSAAFLLFKSFQIPAPPPEFLDLFLKLSPVLLIAVIAGSVFASVKIFQKKEL